MNKQWFTATYYLRAQPPTGETPAQLWEATEALNEGMQGSFRPSNGTGMRQIMAVQKQKKHRFLWKMNDYVPLKQAFNGPNTLLMSSC